MSEELIVPEEASLYGCKNCHKVFFEVHSDIVWGCPDCSDGDFIQEVHTLIIKPRG